MLRWYSKICKTCGPKQGIANINGVTGIVVMSVNYSPLPECLNVYMPWYVMVCHDMSWYAMGGGRNRNGGEKRL